MCCSTIRVTLYGDVRYKQGENAGTYQKASGLINNRSHWIQINGGNVLWWDSITNVWMIGLSSYLTSNTGSISSAQDSACPTTSDNQFKYNHSNDEDGFRFAPINSVSIQCV